MFYLKVVKVCTVLEKDVCIDDRLVKTPDA